MGRTALRHRFGSACTALLALGACGSATPQITSTSVTPSTVQISGIVSTDTFQISCSVLNFSGTVSSVVATVEGQSITVNLAKTGGALGDEQWTGSVSETLWQNISTGTYDIDITATDTDNVSVTQKDAATVTVTN